MSLSSTTRLKIALLTGFSLYCIAACRTSHPVTTDNFKVDKRTANLEHGKALLFSSCGGCHYDQERKSFSGKRQHDLPRILGKSYSANLTVSEKNGIPPQYTDAELAYLLRTGIARDGRFISNMLRPNMADEDLNDLIAYLRSGDGALAAVDETVGKSHLNFLGKMAIGFVAKPQPYRTNISRPREQVAEGRYLVDNIGCFHCHSKKITGLNYLHPERSKGYMAGGIKFKMPGGKVRGANITMDRETGIGFYTKADFRQAVLHMKAPLGRDLRPPMEAFDLTNKEADAIYAYLQTLPPRHHKIKGQPRIPVH